MEIVATHSLVTPLARPQQPMENGYHLDGGCDFR